MELSLLAVLICRCSTIDNIYAYHKHSSSSLFLEDRARGEEPRTITIYRFGLLSIFQATGTNHLVSNSDYAHRVSVPHR